jgi:hypothetical protein
MKVDCQQLASQQTIRGGRRARAKPDALMM